MFSYKEINGTLAKTGTFLGMVWWIDAAKNSTIQSFLCKRYNMTPSQVVAISDTLSRNVESQLLLDVRLPTIPYVMG